MKNTSFICTKTGFTNAFYIDTWCMFKKARQLDLLDYGNRDTYMRNCDGNTKECCISKMR